MDLEHFLAQQNAFIVEQFRALRGDLAELKSGQLEIKQRITNLEISVVNLRRDLVHQADVTTTVQHSVDRLDQKIDRIERRHSLVDHP